VPVVDDGGLITAVLTASIQLDALSNIVARDSAERKQAEKVCVTRLCMTT
jgi:hypothetical protein